MDLQVTDRKNILLTGARLNFGIDLARQLAANGHRIFIAESINWHPCSFSSAVIKNYHVVSPREKPDEFIQSIKKIIIDEKIDLLIPLWEETFYIAKQKDKLPSSCNVFCMPFENLHSLHEKWLFHSKIQSYGLLSPKTYLINNQADLEKLNLPRPFALKACYSRASQRIYKIERDDPLPDLNITPDDLWIAQEWLEGDRYCTYSICHEGEVVANSIYPVEYAIEGRSCLSFRPVEHKDVLAWIKKFVKLEGFTGQIAFDFIELPNNQLYVIECNPRATSGLHLFSAEDRLDTAFLNTTKELILPKVSMKKQIGIGMMLYGWKSLPPGKTISNFFRQFFTVQDVIFSWKDLKPFFFQPFVFMYYLAMSKRKQKNLMSAFLYDLEWNGKR